MKQAFGIGGGGITHAFPYHFPPSNDKARISSGLLSFEFKTFLTVDARAQTEGPTCPIALKTDRA
jgi:hypothetical protein